MPELGYLVKGLVALSNAIDREYVHPYTRTAPSLVDVMLNHLGACIHYLDEGIDGRAVAIPDDLVVRLGRAFGKYFWQALVVLSRHNKVDIIVPGDEAMVPYGAQERSIGHDASQAFLVAHTVELSHNVKLYGFHLGGANAIFFHPVPVQVTCHYLIDCKLCIK